MSFEVYRQTIHNFVNGSVSAEDFETWYLAAFKTEPVGMDPYVYKILEDVFESVDAYWKECLPGQETTFMISEERLREEAFAALNKLTELLKHKGS